MLTLVSIIKWITHFKLTITIIANSMSGYLFSFIGAIRGFYSGC